jgi:hypothetical protein
METENRIERTIGLVLLAVLAIGCLLVLRPFLTPVCFALILMVATSASVRERHDLADARRDPATGTPRAVRGRLVACLQ